MCVTDRAPLKPLLTCTDVTIYVIDVNDNAPVFTKTIFEIAVWENATIDHKPLGQVTAVDLDESQTVTYFLEESAFTIDEKGRVYLLSKLDRETKDTYSLVVMADDQGTPPMTSSATVIITILDVNDNVPKWETQFYRFVLLLLPVWNVFEYTSSICLGLLYPRDQLMARRLLLSRRRTAIWAKMH